MTLKMVENVENYTKIFDFLTKMAFFWTFVKCRKCTGIFEIFRGPFLQNFQVFIETIETVNGTQYPTFQQHHKYAPSDDKMERRCKKYEIHAGPHGVHTLTI